MDDLPSASAGSVGLTYSGNEISGSLGQLSSDIAASGGNALESGYFSKMVSSPSSAGYAQVFVTSVSVQWTGPSSSNSDGTVYTAQLSTSSDFSGAIISSSAVASPVVFTGLTGGTTYYGRVRAVYMGGDVSGYYYITVASVTDSLYEDSNPPVAAILYPQDGARVNSLPQLSGTAWDNVAVSSVVINLRDVASGKYWGGSAWDSDTAAWFNAAVATFTWTYSGPAWVDGSVYVINAKAMDSSGNWSAAYATSTFRYDISAPEAAGDLAAVAMSTAVISINWSAPGDDGAARTLGAGSAYYIQYATVASVSWSTAAAQINISTSGAGPGDGQYYTLGGLTPNTSYYFRLWTMDEAGNYSAVSNAAAALTPIETPTDLYFDEISTGSIVVSAYAPTPSFRNLSLGQSGTNVAINNSGWTWAGWHGESWTSKRGMLTARGSMAAVTSGGKIYAIGGCNSENGSYCTGFTNANEEYDPAADTWTARAVMPTARRGAGGAAVDGKIYAFGGENTNNWFVTPLGINEVYDPALNAWTTRAGMPTSRFEVAGSMAGGRIYAMGGSITAPDTWNNANEMYDPLTNTWTARPVMLNPRNGAASGVVNGRIYLLGGTPSDWTKTEEFDPAASTWAAKASVPVTSHYVPGAALGGKVYLMGAGDTPDKNEEYDPAADTWTDRAPLLRPRFEPAAAAIGGRIYSIGGGVYLGNTFYTDNDMYDPGVASKFSALTPNTLYSFKAKARNQAGLETGETISVSTYTLAAVAKAAGQTFTNVSASAITVNWSSGSAAGGFNGAGASYRVQGSTASDFSGVFVSSVTAGLQFTASGLVANTTYYFRAQAYNAAGVTDYSWLALGAAVAGSKWAPPAGCSSALNVAQDGSGDFTAIQAALDSLAKPYSLSGNLCVVVRDTQTYAEQVTAQGFLNNGYQVSIMADPAFLNSAPGINPPAASTAAFRIMNYGVNVQGINIVPANPVAYGILSSSASLNISSVSVVSGGNIWAAGILISSYSAVSYSGVAVQAAKGLQITGSSNTVTFSTITANSASYALYINGGDYNSVTRSYLSNPAGDGARLDGGANYNSIFDSTMTSSAVNRYAIYIVQSDSNTVQRSYMYDPAGHGAYITSGSDYNTIADSTMTGSSNYYPLLISGSKFNTVTRSYMSNSGGYSAYLVTGANNNTISDSVLVSSTSLPALLLLNASSNLVTRSYISNPAGYGIQLVSSSSYNTISFSTITVNSAYMALNIDGSSVNSVTQSYISNPSGYAAFLGYGANNNSVSSSTILSNAASYFAVKLVGVSSNTVAYDIISNPAGVALTVVSGSQNLINNSTITSGAWAYNPVFIDSSYYDTVTASNILGADGVYVRYSTGTAVSFNVLTATNSAGTGLRMDANRDISAVSNTVSAPATGILLGQGNLGTITLGTDTVTSARYGLTIDTQAAGSALTVAGINVNSLTPNSTGINFLGGQFVSTFTGVGFSSTNTAVNIDGRLLSAGSRITMRNFSGPRAGAAYENDPSGYVDWNGQDTAAPGLALLVPVDASYINSLGVISGTDWDNVAVSSVVVSLRRGSDGFYWSGSAWGAGQTWLNAAIWTSSWTYSALPAWVDGSTYTASVKAVDTSANWSVTLANSFTYDVSSPAAALLVPAAAARVAALAALSGTANDASGVSYPQIRIYDVALDKYWMGGTGSCGGVTLPGWVDNTCVSFPEIWNLSASSSSAGGSFSWSYTPASIAWPDRDNQLRADAKFTDRAGNFSAVSSTFSFDSTPPASLVTYPVSGVVYSSMAAISGTSLDVTSSVSDVKLRMWYLSGGTTYYWTPTLIGGKHWTSTDTGWLSVAGASGPKGTMNPWSYTNSDFSSSTSSFAWKDATHDGLGGKLFYLASKAEDATGNWEVNYSTKSFTFDNTPPTAAVLQPVNASYLNSLPLVSGTAADDVAVSAVAVSVLRNDTGLYWGGASWGASQTWLNASVWSSSWTYSGAPAWIDGAAYTINAKTRDSSGNWSVVYATSAFTYDTTAPAARVTLPVSGQQTSTFTYISGTAADAGGLAQVKVSLKRWSDSGYWSGTTWLSTETWNLASGTTSWAYTGISSAALNYGTTYLAMAEGYDLAGNISSPFNSSSTFTYVGGDQGGSLSAGAFSGVAAGSLTVNWGTTYAPGMVYYVRLSTLASAALPVSSGTATSAAYGFTGLSSNTTYYGYVSTMAAAGYLLAASGPTLALAPSSAAFSGVGYSTAALGWSGGANPAWTVYQYDLSVSSSFGSIAASGSGTASNWLAAGLAEGTTYYGRVSAVNSGGVATSYAYAPAAAVTLAHPNPPPTEAIIQPPNNSLLNSLAQISGTAADDVAVSSVIVSIFSQGTGLYWDGTQWTAGQVWANAAVAGSSWTYAAVPAWTSNSSYTITSAAMDNAGSWSGYSSVFFTYSAAALSSAAFSGMGTNSLTVNWGTTFIAGTVYYVRLSTTGNSSAYLALATTTASAYGFSGLAANTTHYGYVSTMPASGYLLAGQAATLAIAPSSAAFSGVAYSSASFGWSGGADPAWTVYQYEVSLSSAFGSTAASGSGTGSMRTITGLTEGATYYGRVRAVNAGGIYTAYAYAPSAVTLVHASTAAPSGTAASISGAVLGTSSITWTWNSGTLSSAYYFDLYSGGGVFIAALPYASSASYTQAGLTANAAYRLLVAGGNNNGPGTLAASATVYTLAAAPAGLAAANVAVSSAVLSWALNGNSDGTTAQVWRSPDNSSFSSVYEGTALSFTDTSLEECSAYYFKARNRNGGGLYSDFTAAVGFTTMASTPTPPSGLSAEALDGARIALAWDFSPWPGVTLYRLYSDNASGTIDYGTPYAVFSSTVPGWTTPALTAGSSYKFGLRAVNRCGIEEKNTSVYASAQAVGVLSGVRAAIKTPQTGKMIKGNSVTVMAEIILGTVSQIKQVRFQYRTLGSAVWMDISAANANHPNPDTDSPYFVQWDADSMAPATYELRALATDVYNADDPAPPTITVIIDAVNYDTNETVAGGVQQKEQQINNAVTSTVQAADDSSAMVTKVVIPSGAVSVTTVTVTVVSNPVSKPAAPQGAEDLGLTVKINLSNGQSQLSGGKTAAVTLTYKDDDGNGIVDGTTASVDQLELYSAPTLGDAWTPLASTVDRTNKTVSGVTSHFSFFSVFAAAATSLAAVKAYPVPWQPGTGGGFDSAQGITFANLPAAARIKIFTLVGELVRQLDVVSADAGTKVWDGRNAEGHKAASGIYLVHVKSGSGEKTLRIAVER